MIQVLRHGDIKIRKQHRCWGCGELFLSGTIMGIHQTVDGGEFMKSYWCSICQAVWNKYMRSDDGIDMGDLKYNYPEEYPDYDPTKESE
jgi:hypothetical protein